MTPAEALKVTLEKEKASIELYQRMSREHPAIRDLATDLLNEEFKHKKMIEAKIAELTRY